MESLTEKVLQYQRTREGLREIVEELAPACTSFPAGRWDGTRMPAATSTSSSIRASSGCWIGSATRESPSNRTSARCSTGSFATLPGSGGRGEEVERLAAPCRPARAWRRRTGLPRAGSSGVFPAPWEST